MRRTRWWFMFMLLVKSTFLYFFWSIFSFLEPLKLYGEGDYNLNVVKEVKVTDSFLGLDSDVKGCNMEETFENCTTKIYIETVKEKCGCLPFNIYLSDKVQTWSTRKYYVLWLFQGSSLLLQTAKMCKEYFYWHWQHSMSANVQGLTCDQLLKIWESEGSRTVHLTCWQRLWQLQNICQISSLNQR